ncbi:MAG: GNAT family N-acetyltransferase [Chthoniobacterales bacterium]|nr:GNAT family N-acetyltransferase [Chthoniobacterales bacterium]
MATDYVTRALTPEDEPVLWEMLFQGLHTAPGETGPAREVLQRPEIAKYAEGWGREGDRGFVIHDARDQQLLGAVWCRGSTAGETPELAFVVTSGQRKRGIGAALLTQWVRSNPQQSKISLRVRANSPAVRLYERFGFKVVHESETAVTMRREFS